MASSRVMLTGTCLVHAVISENGRKAYKRERKLEKESVNVKTLSESLKPACLSLIHRLFGDLSLFY